MLSVAIHGSITEHVAIDEYRDKTFTRYEDISTDLSNRISMKQILTMLHSSQMASSRLPLMKVAVRYEDLATQNDLANNWISITQPRDRLLAAVAIHSDLCS